MVEDSLKQEFQQSLSWRVDRYLQVSHHQMTPNMHFAPASAECILSFRDGHLYGCVAVAQAVAEAIVRFLHEKHLKKSYKNFEVSVRKLSQKGRISDSVVEALFKIWEARNDYHHLNPGVETDRERLEQLALEKLRCLAKVEGEVFSYKHAHDGAIVPDKPEYWEGSDGEVFLRFLP